MHQALIVRELEFETNKIYHGLYGSCSRVGLDDIAGEEGEKAALALMKDEIRQTMESQFNDIIKEVGCNTYVKW